MCVNSLCTIVIWNGNPWAKGVWYEFDANALYACNLQLINQRCNELNETE